MTRHEAQSQLLNRPVSRALVIGGLCLVALAPFLWLGSPSGHDFEFHMYSWMDVLGQWKQGIVYPRWAALAHWGYGEARFLFYPPASWTLGAALGCILPWQVVPAAYCWIALTLAGAAMYRLARQRLSAHDAMFAAVFYGLNPYHLLIVYWRSAYAELLAAALLPCLLLCLLRLKEPGIRPTLWLSLTLAATWLTNAPSAVMIHYSAAGLALVVAARETVAERSVGKASRLLGKVALAVLLGAGLAAFYLVPASHEQEWINLSQVMAPGVRPQDNFLFTTISDADHNRFNLLVSVIGIAEMAVLAAVIWFARRNQHAAAAALGQPLLPNETESTGEPSRAKERSLWVLLTAWGAASAVLMLSVSNLLWQHLPKFRFVQLPFRWLLCLNAALAMLVTLAFKRWPARLLVSIVLFVVVLLAGHRFQQPWWDQASDIREMSDAIADGIGYEGTDEYVPAGADSYELNKLLPAVSVDGDADHAVPVSTEMLNWEQTEKHFILHATVPEKLVVRLFNYPAWTVLVNGEPVRTETTDITGLIVVPVAAGDSDVSIFFRTTTDRKIGVVIFLVSVLIFLVLWRRSARGSMNPPRILIATSNSGKIRDFAGAAAPYGVSIESIANFSSLLPVVEDGATFEENARKKAEGYSLAAPGEIVLADDSGLEIDALGGAPGVHSARYAAPELQNKEPHAAEVNTDDDANNARVLRELVGTPEHKRTARFVCVLAAARDGKTLQTFRGTAEGVILDTLRGTGGFGYDPLFYFPQIQKTFAELSPEEKARYSHRGAAFRALLAWYRRI
ncbi:MAG TPA: RdgB/HAM1 family non-canonical purine NTP pyrophosphatase [Terriglobales bacterium]|nr:RdgB/HAM1 family non-canonical purine NTP pyrophosphatase [Terriglobales bacterium]